MSDTGKSALSEKDIDRIAEVLRTGGAQISLQDPRVSNVRDWIIAGVGTGVMVVGAWLINSVNKLNETITAVVTTNHYFEKSIDDHTQRIEALERKK